MRAFLLTLGITIGLGLLGQPARSAFFENLLPSWPITNVGEEIPQSLIDMWRGDLCRGKGRFADFPSKGNKEPGNDDRSDLDPGLNCDDGDQTLFNGLLCASGDEEGCRAVKLAQDPNSGRWYRSPHRLWMWGNRCFSKTNPLKAEDFDNQCANGFSPDMNLGVLLYVLVKKDDQAYAKWLNWLDGNSTTTELCRLDAKNKPYDCIKLEWPRLCTHDLGYSREGSFAIDGRYGGNCALRPWDVLDIAPVNRARSITVPARIRVWEPKARALTITAAAALGLTGVPPLLLMSAVDAAHFPLHLDAVRVLLRMIIRNPSLKLDNLPPLPNVKDLTPGLFDLAAPDGTDLFSIRAAAKLIAERASWNPFYQLLAHGPTPAIRAKIIDRCPVKGGVSQKDNWIWEKDDSLDKGVPQNDKTRSMGWDCVFVGQLYNKMRIRKDLSEEFLGWAKGAIDVSGAFFRQLGNHLDGRRGRACACANGP